MILTNEHGFRAEFAVPIPGNMVVITLGRESYHFGFFPQTPRRRLLPATTTIVARHPQNQAATPRIPSKFNCQQAQYLFCKYRVQFRIFPSYLQPESCNAYIRSVKMLINNYTVHCTVQCLITLCEMTLYIRPSVRLCVTFVSNIDK